MREVRFFDAVDTAVEDDVAEAAEGTVDAVGDEAVGDADRKHVTFASGTKLRDARFLIDIDDAEAAFEVAAEGKGNNIGKPWSIQVVDSSHGLDKADSSVQPVQQTQLEPQTPREADEGKLWIQAKAGP